MGSTVIISQPSSRVRRKQISVLGWKIKAYPYRCASETGTHSLAGPRFGDFVFKSYLIAIRHRYNDIKWRTGSSNRYTDYVVDNESQQYFKSSDITLHGPFYLVTSFGPNNGILYQLFTHWGRVTHICVGDLMAHRTFRHRHGRHGRHEVLGMFKTIAQRSPWRSVAHRSLKGGRMKAHTSPWSQNGCTVVGHWSNSKNANIVYQFERHVCLPCTTIVPPLSDQWRPLSDHCGDHCASIQQPRQHLSHHGNGSAFTLPSLRDLLCHYSSFGRSRKAQGSCCSSYTETELSGFRWPLSVLTIFMVAQRWYEGRSPV